MKKVVITKYECEICGTQYETQESAIACEAIPIQHDRGVKVGDLVRITAGDGTGQFCKVEKVCIHQPGWGPKQYDHSVYLTGQVVDSWGHRQLSFNSYEVLP